MAARRRPSADRKRANAAKASDSSNAPSHGRASRARKVDKDGKMAIQCPQCGSEYRIPAEMAESKVQCKHCPRAFFPNATSRPKKTNQAPMIMGAGVALFLLVLFFALNQGTETVVAKPKPPKKVIQLGEANPRVAGIINFAKAIIAKDTYNLAAHSDYTALASMLNIGGDPRADTEIENQIVNALLEGEETQWFRLFEITSAQVDSEAMAEANTGTASLYMSAIDPKHPRFRGTMNLSVQWNFETGKSRVQNWTITKQPRKIAPPVKRHKAHKDIGDAKEVEKMFGGQLIKVREAELVPLGHLEGTSPELQKEIDLKITEMLDIDGPGYNLNRSIRRLREIGKPSIPRLLNKMYETKMDTRDNILRIRRICQALSAMSGERYGFNPAETVDKLSGATDEWRISVLKQWYAWWSDNYDGDYERGIDKSEDLLSDIDGTEKAADEFAEEKKKKKSSTKKK